MNAAGGFLAGPTFEVLGNGNIVVANSLAPETAASAGSTGEIAWDSTHFYICVEGGGPTGAWKRVAISTWS